MRSFVPGRFNVVPNCGIAFMAGVLEHLIVVVEQHGISHGERSRCQNRGIFDLHREVHRGRSRTRKALRDFHIRRRRLQRTGRTGDARAGQFRETVEVRGLDDERIPFPMPARFPLPFLDSGIELGHARGWNYAGLVRHFQHDDDVTRRLRDADTVVVIARFHRNRQPARDATIPWTEVFNAVIHRFARLVAAFHFRLQLLAVIGERRELSIRRIHDQRRLPDRLAGFCYGNGPRCVALFALLGALLGGFEFLIGHVASIAILRIALKTRSDQMVDRPHPGDVGFAPRRHGLLVRSAGGLRARQLRLCRLLLARRCLRYGEQHQPGANAESRKVQNALRHRNNSYLPASGLEPPNDIFLPSGNSIFLELRRKLPSFAGEPVTLILVPAGSESRFQPRRASTLGEPPSTAQCSTVPSGLVTSMCSQEWGLTHSILTTFPSRTTVLDPSNSAEKEWCAVNGIVAASNRPTLATRLSLLRIGLLLNVRIYLLPKSYYESLTVTVSFCFRSSPDKEAYPQTVRTYVPGSARYYQPTDIAASRSSMALCTSRDRRASPRTGCESSRSTGIAQSPSIC